MCKIFCVKLICSSNVCLQLTLCRIFFLKFYKCKILCLKLTLCRIFCLNLRSCAWLAALLLGGKQTTSTWATWEKCTPMAFMQGLRKCKIQKCKLKNTKMQNNTPQQHLCRAYKKFQIQRFINKGFAMLDEHCLFSDRSFLQHFLFLLWPAHIM